MNGVQHKLHEILILKCAFIYIYIYVCVCVCVCVCYYGNYFFTLLYCFSVIETLEFISILLNCIWQENQGFKGYKLFSCFFNNF